MSSNPTGLSPSTIATNLCLWLDASDSTTLQYSSGTTLSNWLDKSGSNNNATGGTPPSYSNASIGVYFNGGNFMNLPNNTLPSGNASYTYFLLFTMTAANNSGGIIGGGTNTTNGTLNIRGNGANGIWQYWYGNDIGTTTSYTVSARTIYETWYTSGSTRNLLLNYAGSNSDTPGTRSQTNGTNAIGRTTVNEYMIGYIHELLVYSNVLTGTQRENVEGYLAWKWGLTSALPSTNPYKNNPWLPVTESVPRSIPSSAFIVPINTYSTIKTFTLPTVSTNPGRLLILKDYLGYSGANNIRLSTLGLDRIERSNVSSMALSAAYGAWWFQNDGVTKWFLTSAYLNSISIVQAQPPYLPGLWMKNYANTGSIPDSNGPPAASGGSGWGAPLTTTFVGGIYAGSNTPGATSVFYYGNNFGVNPSGNGNFSYTAYGFFYSATSGTIQFQMETDDGMRIDFNGVNMLNQWQQQGQTGYTSGSVSLPAGYTPLRIRWYDTGGGGASLFRWSINGAAYTSNGVGSLFYSASNITQL